MNERLSNNTKYLYNVDILLVRYLLVPQRYDTS
jgi:hypothetical protein